MLDLENISVTIKKKQVLKDLNLSAHFGEIIGLVAPNGTGKTTLLRTIVNLLKPDQGIIKISDMTMTAEREHVLKKVFFMQDHAPLYPWLNGFEHLQLIKRLWHSDIDITGTVEQLQMTDYIRKRTSQYSLGMKQRLLFAMTLVSSADLLLMDEPMNGLDPSSIRLVSEQMKELRAQGKLIIFSSHILSNVDELCDRVIFLKNGTVIRQLDRQSDEQRKQLTVDFFTAGDAASFANLCGSSGREIIANDKRVSIFVNSADLSDFIIRVIQRGINYRSLHAGLVSSAAMYEQLYESGETNGSV